MLVCSFAEAQGRQKQRLLSEFFFRTFTGGVIVVEAKLDTHSRPLHFILDSGSGGISIDSTTAAELAIPQRVTDTIVSGIGGRKQVSFSFNRTLHFPKLAVDSLHFYINDYSMLTSIYGERIDGIIGYSLLKRYIINVNFDTARIRIYKPGKISYAAGGSILRPRINFLALQPATVRDNRSVPFNFFLDTGAGLCLLLSEQFNSDSSVISPKRKFVETQSEGLGGRIHLKLTVAKQVKLAQYKFNNVPVYLYNDSLNITAYPQTGGLIGNDLMRRFNLTFNYPKGEVHIVPNTHFNDEFDYAYTGLLIIDVNHGIFVDDVIPKSPAAYAGLRLGDEVIGINNDYTGRIVEYTKTLQRAKETLIVVIRRDGELMKLSLKPESILR